MELPTPVRVLVVDDSAVVRKVLGDVLNSNSGTTLAGTASSGEAALSKIDDLKPDVVTLDIEMPGMNGLEALAEIRKRHPRLPVIMFSTLTESGGTAPRWKPWLLAQTTTLRNRRAATISPPPKTTLNATLSVKSFRYAGSTSRGPKLIPQLPYRSPKRSRGELMSWPLARPPAVRML